MKSKKIRRWGGYCNSHKTFSLRYNEKKKYVVKKNAKSAGSPFVQFKMAYSSFRERLARSHYHVATIYWLQRPLQPHLLCQNTGCTSFIYHKILNLSFFSFPSCKRQIEKLILQIFVSTSHTKFFYNNNGEETNKIYGTVASAG